MSGRRPVRRVYLFAAAVAGAAAAGTWWLSNTEVPPGAFDLPIVFFVAAFIGCELLPIHIEHRRETLTLSLSTVPLILGLYALTPGHLIVARLLGAIIAMVIRRLPHFKATVNIAGFWLECVAAFTVFAVLRPQGSGPDSWHAAILAALAADASQSIVVAIAITIFLGRREPGLLRSQLLGTAAVAVDTCVALVLVTLLVASPAAAVLFSVVVVMVLLSYRAHSALRDRLNELENLYRLTKRMTAARSIDEVVAGLLADVRELMHADRAVLFIDGSEHNLLQIALDGDGTTIETTALAVDSEVAALHEMAHQSDGATVVTPPIAPSALRALGVHQAMITALALDGKMRGSLVVADRSGTLRPFGNADRRSFLTVANHVSMAVESSRRADDLQRHVANNEHLAMHDALTGLPNRRLFQRRLEAALSDDPSVGVLFIDLDRFKEVNDTLGHGAGDTVLLEVAARLRDVLDGDDTAARFGGDEFAVLLPGVDDAEAAVAVAVAVMRAISRPVTIDQDAVEVGASVGVAVGPEHGSDGSTLMACADAAMYVAKGDRSGVELYRPEYLATVEDANRGAVSGRRVGLVADMRRAIENDELDLVFQPQVNLATGRPVGAEALLRWNHPVEGAVKPDEFIAIAEALGLIGPITDQVLGLALAAAAAESWRELDLRVSVNLSHHNLLQANFAADVQTHLDRVGIRPAGLCLELSESAMMSGSKRAVNTMHELAELGVTLSIDNFGTGDATLAHLKGLLAEEVKIDKSFMTSMGSKRSNPAFIRSIIYLAKALDFSVVAEGVETYESAARLADLGCGTAQGYFFSVPLTKDAFGEWLDVTAGEVLAAGIGSFVS